MSKKVVIIGSAHPLRGGGLATFNHRLCKAFLDAGDQACIYSFSLQYPSFLFPGKSQFTDEPAPKDLEIYSLINSIHPFNWWQVGDTIRRIQPDIVVVRYWLPFMGPALGTILRQVKKNKHTKIIAITDNVIPHEKRPGDTAFTKYFLKPCDGFITMSQQVLNDLKKFDKVKPVLKVNHPLYDNFGEKIEQATARKNIQLPLDQKILLFFGFIRAYKGLDLLIDAVKILKDQGKMTDKKLVIAGEFYDAPDAYLDQIRAAKLEDEIILRTDFIPDAQVRNYICSADLVVQPYKSATQSGVTPLAYHFEVPMVVTNVGGLPDLVQNGKVGWVAEPNATDIANKINEFFTLPYTHYQHHIIEVKKTLSWNQLVESIHQMAADLG